MWACSGVVAPIRYVGMNWLNNVSSYLFLQAKLTFGGISVEMSLGGVFLGAGVCLSWGVRVFRTKRCGLSAYAFVHLLVGNPIRQIPENIGRQCRLGVDCH